MASILVAILSVSLSACKSDKIEKKSNLGTMTFSISGVSNNLEIDQAFIRKRTETDSKGDHTLYTMIVHGKDQFSSVDFAVNVWDWQNPPMNGVLMKEYSFDWQGPEQQCTDNNSACDGATISYYLNSKGFSDDQSNLDDSYAKITKCDAARMLVSGEFRINVKEVGGNERQQLIGSFTDVNYSIE